MADRGTNRKSRGLLAIYFAAIFRAFPGLRSDLAIDLACILPLLGFGAWITLSSVITPLMVYLDRILIGSLMSMAALAAYSVPMEIVSKSFILPAAISGVMFPAFARSFAAAPEELARLFVRSLKLVALILCPVCAAVVAFAPQIMWFWIGHRIRRARAPRFCRYWRSALSSPASHGYRWRCCTARIGPTSSRKFIWSTFLSTRWCCG